MHETITIDGSQGEGGGQILRTALGLSLCTGQPIEIRNIRSKREKSGLLRQHHTCVNAAATISSGHAEGNELRSPSLFFKPGKVQAGHYRFSIGTAGSTTLVLQTILPALMTQNAASTIELEGGTHNPMAPTLDFLQHSFLPLLRKMGVKTEVTMEKYGFFPKGGGIWKITIQPSAKLKPVSIQERKGTAEYKAHAVVVNLRHDIGDRELKVVKQMLGWQEQDHDLRTVRASNSIGQGNLLNLYAGYDNITEVITGFGTRGVRAEDVARTAATEMTRYLASRAPVGEHLTDQLLIPVALAGGGDFLALKPSLHTITNIQVIEQMLGVKFQIEKIEPDLYDIRLN
jgi:RNA 3'-terminal phosphate cyclase (ATP)